ncbi:disulfide oxidoreductase related to ResA [Nonlabens marinus S1-08]|uniref:Disulfide oxidoreductase related to ResA n=2 Tax=Nonlabens TaxID=363408 RepID=W8VWM9_9FLAO|nr:disulfide oxidoreductase related to ResA [Nonlabens marinus S1-08]
MTMAQMVTVPVINDKVLSTLKELDPKAPASDEIDFDTKKISYYDIEGNILDVDAKKAYRNNPEYSIDRMFADSNNVVRVVIYKKSSAAEKAQRQSFQMSLKAMDPNYFKGQYAKPFSVTDMDGNVYTNESLKGKVVVLNFWFIGCAPCIEEMPVLNQLVDKYKGKDVVFLAITYNKKSELEEFLNKKQFDYQIIPENTAIASEYKIMAYPDHIIIDKKSVIQYKGNLNKDRLFDFMSEYIDLCLAAK